MSKNEAKFRQFESEVNYLNRKIKDETDKLNQLKEEASLLEASIQRNELKLVTARKGVEENK